MWAGKKNVRVWLFIPEKIKAAFICIKFILLPVYGKAVLGAMLKLCAAELYTYLWFQYLKNFELFWRQFKFLLYHLLSCQKIRDISRVSHTIGYHYSLFSFL